MSFDIDMAATASASTAVPPGASLAARLAEALAAAGFPTLFPVTQWESYGWEWTVSADGVRIWLMIQESDPAWLIITDAPRSLMERLRGTSHERVHRRVCEALGRILTAEVNARDVRWFTREEMGSAEGAAAP